MTTHTHPRLLGFTLILFASFGVGCGDVGQDELTASFEAAGLEGLTVQLARHSTHCTGGGLDGAVARIGADMEFPAEVVAELEAPCPESPSPALDAYFAGNSLVFDFAHVAESGSFPNTEFDGYTVAFARDCGDPVVATVAVDPASSSMDVPEHRVQTDFDRIEVNFAGMAFDANAFVKIDLDVIAVDCADF